MPSAHDLAFACPRCDRALDESEAGFGCAGCKVEFPSLAGIPFLFAEPAAALAEWRERYAFLLETLKARHGRYERALRDPALPAASRRRLETLAAATAEHGRQLGDILAPLAAAAATGKVETYLALRTRLPPDQGLTTYSANVHRDWCWGREENEASLGIVLDALGEHAADRCLVLGAGAGRLAYDLHAQTAARATTALDFNPLPILLADRLAAGETIELHEFPLAPLGLDHVAPLNTLAAPAPARAGLRFCLADAARPPFAEKSFDTIVTPWLVDILPGVFADFCARLNHLLADGGVWINFGSLSFHHADPKAQLTPEECFEIIADQGFAAPEHGDTRIPYLSSPASRHARTETVLSWRARKEKHKKKVTRYEALPDWLVRGKDPVPALEHFRVQAMSTRIHAFVLSMIDGKRSIADMAALIEQQRLMSAQEAESAIRGLLIKVFDESRTRGRY
jgi:hypothetical protein